MRQVRIRRDEQPGFIRHEMISRKAYNHARQIKWNGHSVTLNYRRSRWIRVADLEVVRRRESFCWVLLGKQRVSAFQLFEYEVSPEIDNAYFIDVMDAESSIEYSLAEVLCESWEQFSEDVTLYGNLLDFRMAWADPIRSPHGLWCAAASELIASEFADHSLLTMKAFPLEYEGRAPPGANSHLGLLSRQKAMMRYYRRQFDVVPFPGPSGAEGWLYKINEALEGTVAMPCEGNSLIGCQTLCLMLVRATAWAATRSMDYPFCFSSHHDNTYRTNFSGEFNSRGLSGLTSIMVLSRRTREKMLSAPFSNTVMARSSKRSTLGGGLPP